VTSFGTSRKFPILLALIAILSVSTVGLGQKQRPIGQVDMNRIRLAESYHSQGRLDMALEILLELDKSVPNQPAVLELLFNVYKDSKNYDAAEEVIQRRESIWGNSPQLHLLYGDLYLRSGRFESANAHLDSALYAMEGNVAMYPKVANIYRANGLYDQAEQVYLSGKSRFKDPSMFSMELGQLHEVRRNYESAIHEYYIFATADTLNEMFGSQRITRLIEYVEDPDDVDAVKRAFYRIRKDNPDDPNPRRYLAEILLNQDSVELSFELYKEVDRLSASAGGDMIHFVGRSLERGRYELATEACNYLLAAHPKGPYQFQARRLLARSFVQTGQADSAIVLLHKILEIVPDFREKMETNAALGEVYLENLKNADSALVYFAAVASDKRQNPLKTYVAFRTGDAYLVKGEPHIADSIFSTVPMNILTKKDQEELLWRAAQTKFFTHDFDTAKIVYASLTTRYRKSLYVNDCLRKMLMIDENTGFDLVDLGSFADAEYHEFRGMSDSAIAVLSRISRKEGSKLADIATLRLGELFLSLERYDDAIGSFNFIKESFEESFWRGEAQKYLADTYYTLGDKDKASAAYRELLTDYENVSIREHARERMKELENL